MSKVQLKLVAGKTYACPAFKEGSIHRGDVVTVEENVAKTLLEDGYYEKFLAFVGGDGADVIIECAGNHAAVESAFKFARRGATILLFSVPKVEATYEVPLFDVYQKELTIKGTFVNPDTHLRAVELINSGRIQIAPIITHTFTLDELPEAIAMQMSAEAIKEKKKQAAPKDGSIVPKRFMNELGNHLERDAVVVADVGQNQIWAAKYIHLTDNRFLTSGGLGTMG